MKFSIKHVPLHGERVMSLVTITYVSHAAFTTSSNTTYLPKTRNVQASTILVIAIYDKYVTVCENRPYWHNN